MKEVLNRLEVPDYTFLVDTIKSHFNLIDDSYSGSDVKTKNIKKIMYQILPISNPDLFRSDEYYGYVEPLEKQSTLLGIEPSTTRQGGCYSSIVRFQQ